MNFENVVHGMNSVLCDSEQKSVLYEKLSNTIHTDTRDKLEKIQKRVEAVDYRPTFETHSLKKKKDEHL